ncbi:MAG: glycosyltransferase family 2 protein [Planctomycetota bacterium]|jgi:glycosyltransferase involved in cell wall biosynthesis|nr:glycosyltransferase family 2 protein [Planctomycetota bacterium]
MIQSITVVTCTMNSQDTLDRCIDSVTNQIAVAAEHLIIDGGSSDNTIAIAKSRDLRYLSEPDDGIYDAFNKGIRNASGDAIMFLGSDDVFAHNKVLTEAVSALEEDGSDLVHAQMRLIRNEKAQLVGRPVSSQAELLKRMTIAHPTLCARRQVFEQFGDFDTSYRIAADYDFCLRIWDKVSISFRPTVWIEMAHGGISTSRPSLSLKEARRTQICHGRPPWVATAGMLEARLRFFLRHHY